MPNLIEPGEIHAELAKVLNPNEIDHWQSDLYCKVTQASKEVISRFKYKNLGLITTFIDNINHEIWYEIPFCYNPEIDKNHRRGFNQ